MLAVSFCYRQSISALFDLALRCNSHTDSSLSPVIEGDEVKDGERPDQQKDNEEKIVEPGSWTNECDRSF